MALTDAEICNIALGRIGQTQPIADLADDSAQAAACRVVYQHCRNTTLEAADWGFARKHLSLPLLTSTREGWAYAFSLPNDCLVPRNVFNGVRPGGSIPAGAPTINPWRGGQFVSNLASPPPQPFETELSDDGQTKWLLCDLNPAILFYTSSLASNGVFSETFIDALAWRIACETALSLPIKAELSLNAAKQYEATIAAAKALNLRSRRDDPAPQSQFITSRG